MNLTAFYRHVHIRELAKTKTFTVMKLTAIILLVGCLQVSAAGYSQKVSISTKNASLETVFKEIKKQTGYMFFYNAKVLESAHDVDLNVKDATLTEVLKVALKDQPLSFSIVNNTIVITQKVDLYVVPGISLQASAGIHGKIVDDKTGAPIMGASIVIRGDKSGAQSNGTGEFNLPYPKGTKLIISYIGYENAELTVGDNDNYVTIRLKLKTESMDNTVVTGYQVIKKESFTGTAVTVSGEDLKKVNPNNLLQSIAVFDPSFKIIENNVLGSNPNRLPNINVRGSTALPSGSTTSGTDAISRSNLSGNVNQPTFILDGFEVSLQKVYDLDINRVQSITLLKDAAATAIYGSRAANGVLVITTKPPKAGKLQMSYNYELNVTAPDLTDYHVLNAADKLEYERLSGLYDGVKQGVNQDKLDAQYYHKKELVASGVNTYWLSQPLQTAFGNKNSLYVEGGTNEIRFGLDLRYQTAPGVMKGSGRDRFSVGMNVSYNPSATFVVKNTLTATQVNSKESPYGSFSDYVSMNPYYKKSDSAGNAVRIIDQWPVDGKYVNRYNPLYDAQLGSFNKSQYLELIDVLSAQMNITNNLHLLGQVSVTKTNSTGDQFTSPFANAYYEYSAADIKKKGQYDYNTNNQLAVEGMLNLNYNTNINGHYINFLLGTNFQTNTSDYKAIQAIGFTNDRFTDIGFANSYPKGTTPYSAYNKDKLIGFFAGLNYTYKNIYLMDINFREDGSSKYGSANKMAPFASLGLGWNIHKEKFFHSNIISQLKLRASTGITGSVNFEPYMANTTYTYYSDNWYSTGVGASVGNVGNNNLKWQKTNENDIGLDLGLLKDRITISPRYYYKYTKGMLTDIILAPSTGSKSQKANLGDVVNEGLELGIRGMVFKNKNWTVSVFANMTTNKNEIKKISNSLKKYNDDVDQDQTSSSEKASNPALRYTEGQSVYAIYAVRSLGIDPQSGKEIFLKKDGTLTYDWDVKDNVAIAESSPKGEGYFGGSVTFKGFSLNVNMHTKFGGYMYNQTLIDRVENADPQNNVDQRVFDDRWKQAGDRTFFKDIANQDDTKASSRFVQKDNLLDLESVYFSYDFSRDVFSKLHMKNLRFAFTMNDVWRWSSIRLERGLDYPFARSFTFSLQTSF